MNEKLKDVGMRIKQARKESHMSQEELAGALDISTSHMSDIENGKTNIGLEIFMNLTEILQVSADWLLRTNIPLESQNAIQDEVNIILSDCSLSEIQSIARIIQEIKKLSKNKSNKKS